MVMNRRPFKRLKRRITADLNDFLTFPETGLVEVGPFRTAVREFLTAHALPPPPSSLLPELLTWQLMFRVGERTDDGVVRMDVVEEDVAGSRSVYCDQCRVVGWSGHPVCAKRYHFIIKADGCSVGGYNKSCSVCGDDLNSSDPRCKSCNHVMTTEEIEDWLYSQLEDTTHLLHGVIHSNGYGHLLRVNGIEGGSRILPGSHIMDFWDRLCKVLGVRKVSVMDVSKKYGVELRLLHAITKGHPWYGEWGFEFGAGSYGITLDAYEEAIKTLSDMPLSTFLSQGRKPRTRLQDLISFYQSLSEQELVNIRDLFFFILDFINKSRVAVNSTSFPNTCNKNVPCGSRVLCAWNIDDVVRVEEAMLRVLRAVSGSSWVSWRALRGAVCKVGPPELLDYCLKELHGKQAADGTMVNSRFVPNSGAIEYRLDRGIAQSIGQSSITSANCPSVEHLLRDLRYLYESLLHPGTMVPHLKKDAAINAATKLLDCKQFVKTYYPENHMISKAYPIAALVACELESIDEEGFGDAPVVTPPEPILLSSHNATISDLKLEASKALQEVYLILRRFQAEEVIGYRGVDESTQVKLLLGSISTMQPQLVTVRARCHGKNGGILRKYRMERGIDMWTVDCICGAKDDDGERMLSCDACGVWYHTRCSCIPDSEAVPAKYVCYRCGKVDGDGADEMLDTIAICGPDSINSIRNALGTV